MSLNQASKLIERQSKIMTNNNQLRNVTTKSPTSFPRLDPNIKTHIEINNYLFKSEVLDNGNTIKKMNEVGDHLQLNLLDCYIL